jgi:hypothetical protein
MAPNKDQIYEARSALRKYSAGQVEKVYAAASKSVGDQLQFSSSRHLVTGLVGLISDGVYTLWEPAKNVLNSEVLKGLVEDKLGIVVPAGQSLLETVVDKASQDKSPAEKKKMKSDVEKGLEGVKRFEAYQQNLAEYAQQKGKSPYEILKSKKDRMEVMFRTYNPYKEYEKSVRDTTENIEKVIEQIDSLEVLAKDLEVGSLVNELLESKLGRGSGPDLISNFDESVLKELGIGTRKSYHVSLDTLGIGTENVNKIALDYIKDIVIFGKAMVAETIKSYDKEAATFRKYCEKKSGKAKKPIAI